MKVITADPERLKTSNVFFESGPFKYTVDASWIKWPEEAKGFDCLCVNYVGEDLYVATSCSTRMETSRDRLDRDFSSARILWEPPKREHF